MSTDKTERRSIFRGREVGVGKLTGDNSPNVIYNAIFSDFEINIYYRVFDVSVIRSYECYYTNLYS